MLVENKDEIVESLSQIELNILNLINISYKVSLDVNNLKLCLIELGIKENAKTLSSSLISQYLKKLEKQKIIDEKNIIINKNIAGILIGIHSKDKSFEQFCNVLDEVVPSKNTHDYYWQRNINFDKIHQKLRISFYKKDDAKFNNLLHRQGDLYQKVWNNFDYLSFFQNEDDFEQLSFSVKSKYLEKIIFEVTLKSYVLTNIDKNNIKKILTVSSNCPHFLMNIFTWSFLSKDENKMREAAHQLKLISGEGEYLEYYSHIVKATFSFLSLDFDLVATCYIKITKLYRMISPEKNAFSPSFLAILYPLALLKIGDDKSSKKLKTILKQILTAREGTNPYIESYKLLNLVYLEKYSTTKIYSMAWEELHWGPLYDKRVIRDHGILQFMYPLICYYLGKNIDHCELLTHYQNNCEKNQTKWLESQVKSLLTKISPTHFPEIDQGSDVQLSCFFNVQAPWEKDLDKIKLLFSKPKEKLSSSESRIIWLVNESGYGSSITPKLQKRSHQGKIWSAGRNAALKTLVQGEEKSITLFDQKVISKINADHDYYGGTKYRLDREQALFALVGHPYVYLDEGEKPRLIEIKESRLDLNIKETKYGYHVSFDHTFFEYEDFIFEMVNENTYEIIKIPKWAHGIKDIIKKEGLLVPKNGLEVLNQTIEKLSNDINIQSNLNLSQNINNDISLEITEETIFFGLYPLRDREGLRFEVLVRPLGEETSYMVPGKGHQKPIGQKDSKRYQVIRSFEDETSRVDELISRNPILQKLYDHNIINHDYSGELDELEFCLELVGTLKQLALEEQVSIIWPRGEVFKISSEVSLDKLKINISGAKNWFKIDGNIEVSDHEVMELDEIIKLSQDQNTRFIKLKNGQFLQLEKKLREKIEDLEVLYDKSDDDEFLVHSIKSSLIYDVINGIPKVKANKSWKDQAKKHEDLVKYDPQIPKTLDAKLRDYQIEGVEWLLRLKKLGLGACLADDMGLGKTLQIITVMLESSHEGPSLVIAPTSVERNWFNEIKNFAPTLNPIIFRDMADRSFENKKIESGDIIIVSYGLLQNYIDEIDCIKWNILALDEAQAIKNSGTKRSKIVKKLNADFRIIATGTPVENHLRELWSQFDFILPDLLGKEQAFLSAYTAKLEDDGPLRQGKRLKKLLAPFILRRLKRDVLKELPMKTQITLDVELSEEERVFYNSLLKIAIKNIESDEPVNSKGGSLSANADNPGKKLFKILAEITRLRQACCHPSLISKDINIKSSKLELFSKVVLELKEGAHRALVFSQFVGHLKIISEKLTSMGISFFYLDGQTPVKKREELIRRFQAGEADLFLISLKAGGTGINLTAADYVIHMDPWWNPAVEDQATDRAHRIGQTRPVTVYKMVAKNTIEEKIIKLHEQKKELAHAVIDGHDSVQQKNISSEDLLNLLRF